MKPRTFLSPMEDYIVLRHLSSSCLLVKFTSKYIVNHNSPGNSEHIVMLRRAKFIVLIRRVEKTY